MQSRGEADPSGRRFARRSDCPDPLEVLSSAVDFEVFRPTLLKHVGGQERSGDGCRSHDLLVLFKTLILQVLHDLSLEDTIFLVRDRLSWWRFCGLGPEDEAPSVDALWGFRDALLRACALEGLIAELDRMLTEAGYLAMTGNVVDMRLLPVPRRETAEGGSAVARCGGAVGVGGKVFLERNGDSKSLLDVAVKVRRDEYSVHGIQLSGGSEEVGSKPLAELLGERRVSGMHINLESMALVSNIHRASVLIRNHFERRVLSEADLYWSAFVALWCLWIYGDLETRRLAIEMGVPKSTLSTILKLLEGRGLVLRRRNERERRLVIIKLTGRGRDLISDLFPKFNAEETRISASLSTDQIHSATTAIRMILSTISDLDSRGEED